MTHRMFLRADKLHKHGTKRPQNDWSLQIHERFHIQPFHIGIGIIYCTRPMPASNSRTEIHKQFKTSEALAVQLMIHHWGQ